ncbi:MAG: ferrochelatase [Deltaproteobacteria bacterium]|nr:MAG: ferrochelatase [Deltaproteobacteria bacterium]
MSEAGKIGVVWINTGGPESEQDVPRFIRDMLSDPHVMPVPWPIRPLLAGRISRRRREKVLDRYRRMGLPSPVLETSRRQAEELGKRLGSGFSAVAAFRYSRPSIRQACLELAGAGVRKVVGLAAFPQASGPTTKSCRKEFGSACRSIGLEGAWCRSFPDDEGFISSLAEPARQWASDGTAVLACAHGIPRSMADRGDPYPAEVDRTRRALEGALGVEVRLAFQSRLGKARWLEPYIEDAIREVAGKGARRLVLVPVSFVCENLETHFDLDEQAVRIAKEAGIPEVFRVPAPSVAEPFLGAMAGLVEEAVRSAGWDGKAVGEE